MLHASNFLLHNFDTYIYILSSCYVQSTSRCIFNDLNMYSVIFKTNLKSRIYPILNLRKLGLNKAE